MMTLAECVADLNYWRKSLNLANRERRNADEDAAYALEKINFIKREMRRVEEPCRSEWLDEQLAKG